MSCDVSDQYAAGTVSSTGAPVARAAARCVLVMLCALTSLASAAEQKTPQEVYGGRPNNLDQLPEGWVSDTPIELVVSFNLESAANSEAANAFLRTWYESITALPYDVALQVKRRVAPQGFTYAVSLTFNNWEEYREYETSEDFLAYYYAHWKPRVHEAREDVFLLDPPPASAR